MPCQSRYLLAWLLCCLLAGCGGPSARIAYVGSQGDLFTVAPDGRDSRTLAPGAYAWPTWSPDGASVAATRVESDGSGRGVYALPAGGGEPRPLFAADGAAPFFAAWSPDGRSIAVLARESTGVALHVRTAAGTEGRRLLVGEPLYLAWRPDSRAIVAHVDGDSGDTASARVVLAPADGADPTSLPAAPNAFRAPAVTPDGRTTLVGAVGSDGRGAIVALDADGAPARTLLADGYAPSFVLSPKGNRLAASRAVAGARGVLDGVDVVDLATGAVTRWHNGPVVAFFWSPDGSRLAWAAVDWSGSELQWHVAEAPGAGRQVAAFTPSLPFASILAFFDQYASTTGVWSPDSRALVFAGWGSGPVEGPSRIWVANAAGGTAPRSIAEGTMASWSPR